MPVPDPDNESESSDAEVDPFEELGVQTHISNASSSDGLEAFMEDDEEEAMEAAPTVESEQEEDDDDVEVAHRHQLREALGRRPLVQPRRLAQPLAQLLLLEVVDAQDLRELPRLGLAHLGRRRAAEEHAHLLVQVQQVLHEAQQPHVAAHRL